MSTVNNMQIQDDEGNVFHPETSIEQIVGENGTQVFPGGKPGNMESSDMTTAFTESKMRAVSYTHLTLPTILRV